MELQNRENSNKSLKMEDNLSLIKWIVLYWGCCKIFKNTKLWTDLFYYAGKDKHFILISYKFQILWCSNKYIWDLSINEYLKILNSKTWTIK